MIERSYWWRGAMVAVALAGLLGFLSLRERVVVDVTAAIYLDLLRCFLFCELIESTVSHSCSAFLGSLGGRLFFCVCVLRWPLRQLVC